MADNQIPIPPPLKLQEVVESDDRVFVIVVDGKTKGFTTGDTEKIVKLEAQKLSNSFVNEWCKSSLDETDPLNVKVNIQYLGRLWNSYVETKLVSAIELRNLKIADVPVKIEEVVVQVEQPKEEVKPAEDAQKTN